MSPEEASRLICEVLDPSDLKAPYNRPPPGAHRLWGHCAVASEALFYGTGGLGPASQLGPGAGGPKGWTVWRVPHEGSTHWFLKDRDQKIWDLTAEQFRTPVPYHQAKKTFFVTSSAGQGASRRALEVLRRVKVKAKGRRSNPAWLDPARLGNPTAPVAPRDVEIGLMTAEQFLTVRNPQGTSHSDESYDWGIEEMNRPIATSTGRGPADTTVSRYPRGDVVADKDGQPVAILVDGTLYFEKHRRVSWGGGGSWDPSRSDITFHDGRSFDRGWDTLRSTNKKVVKYLDQYRSLAEGTASERSTARYPYVMRRMIIDGESFQLRAEVEPVPGKGTALALVNDAGQIVAVAQNEWGATLIVVAREYRGKRLGGVLSDVWYSLNPRFQSGGFTPQGRASALRAWESRVRSLAALGWYTSLVRDGSMTQAMVAEIFAGLSSRHPRELSMLPESETRSPAKSISDNVRIQIDPGISFLIYDSDALAVEHPDEIEARHVFAYGFFRDSGSKTFLYAIDYEPAFANLAVTVALQMARDDHTPIYVGPGYGDFFDVEGVEGVTRTGDFVQLDHDVLDLQPFARIERRLRKLADPLGEKGQMLLEVAEAKWR
jgi:hypothetical protein